jgi:hypothetical protein
VHGRTHGVQLGIAQISREQVEQEFREQHSQSHAKQCADDTDGRPFADQCKLQFGTRHAQGAEQGQ